MERLGRGSDLALVESSTLNVERLRRVSKGEGGALRRRGSAGSRELAPPYYLLTGIL